MVPCRLICTCCFCFTRKLFRSCAIICMFFQPSTPRLISLVRGIASLKPLSPGLTGISATLLSVQAKRPYPDRSVLIPLVKVLNKFLHFAYINFEHMLRTSLTTISVHIHWNERGSYFVNRFKCWSSKRNLRGTAN